jgi:hypothetical protein
VGARMGLLINADREKHLDRFKVFVGCSLSRSNQVEESGRDGRPASRGCYICYERLVWLYGFVKHGCKKLMGKFHLVLSNPCVTKTISASGFAYSSANGHFQWVN